MARKRLSENVLVNWLSQFRRHPEPETSPELDAVRRKRNRFEIIGAPPPGAAPPVPVEAVPVETVSPPAPEKVGPPPRMLRIVGDQLFEVGQDGRLYLASDDGRQEESISTRWKKAREREINFGYDGRKEWEIGQGN